MSEYRAAFVSGVKPEDVDQVILGCVGQVAEDGYISRHAAVKAGMPVETPAYTVNRICGSGLEAINTAARWLQTGDAEIIVAGGVENMSAMPFYLRKARYGYKYGHDQLEDGTMHLLTDPFDGILMGETAENLAEKYEVSRELQDEYSLQSQERARVAIDEGRFKEQILPIEVRKGRETVTFDTDEHPRSTDMETLGKLRTIFRAGEIPAIQVSDRIARLPGLTEMLKARVGGEVFVLEPGATARGTLARCPKSADDTSGVSLIRRLPWDQAAVEIGQHTADRSQAGTPTHLLHGHTAHAIGNSALVLGSQEGEDALQITLASDMPGISRRHCSLLRKNGQCRLEDHSRYGTFLNGHRIDGSTVLQVGDVLRVGSPGFEFQLITTDDTDG